MNPQRPPAVDTEKKNRRDIGASIFAFAFSAAFLAYYVVMILVRQEFDTPLGHVVGGVPIGDLGTAQIVLYSVGIGIKVFCLVGLVGVLFVAARNMLRGEFFSVANARYFTAACWFLIATSVGVFIEGMGDNWYASQVGLEEWAGLMPSPLAFVIWYVFLLTLSLVAVVLRRGVRMQEDVDGLV